MKTLILFVILSNVPPWVADQARLAFTRWAAYEAFEVEERNDPSAIRVEWRVLPGNHIGEARSMAWGHPYSAIALNSNTNWHTRDDMLLQVAMHEIGHIVLNRLHHTWGDPTALMSYSVYRRVVRLNWDEQMGLLSRYVYIRPIPQELIGPWRP